jgi:hypothetical protein
VKFGTSAHLVKEEKKVINPFLGACSFGPDMLVKVRQAVSVVKQLYKARCRA